MKAFLLPGILAALALFSTSCDCACNDDSGCAPKPRCVSGTVLRRTCVAGTLIQLQDAKGGQTVQFDFDGTGVKTYHHVISTYTDLGSLSAPGSRVSFTYEKGGPMPDLAQCQAFDAPPGLERCELSNLSAQGCSADNASSQTRQL